MKQAEIDDFVGRIVHQFHPERVVLFGSHAFGTPTPYSDVDLLVVMPYTGSSLAKSVEILRKTHPRFAVDLVVKTADEMDRRLSWGDPFIREIVSKGRVLYEATYG